MLLTLPYEAFSGGLSIRKFENESFALQLTHLIKITASVQYISTWHVVTIDMSQLRHKQFIRKTAKGPMSRLTATHVSSKYHTTYITVPWKAISSSAAANFKSWSRSAACMSRSATGAHVYSFLASSQTGPMSLLHPAGV